MLVTRFPEAHLLIVDDQESNLRLLEDILAHTGFKHITALADPTHTVQLCLQQQVDLLLLDLIMPQMDGYAVLRALREALPPGDLLPVVVLTADSSPAARRQALACGATDFLHKPLDVVDCFLRIDNLLHLRTLHCQVQRENRSLFGQVQERDRQLAQAQVDVLIRLARMAEYHHEDMRLHPQRVAALSARIAQTLGYADPLLLGQAALLHDVGKIGVRTELLSRKGELTAAEFEEVKKHTTIGHDLLAGSPLPLLQLAATIALSHHERWDGTGYPGGLAATAIPLEARIVGLADVFDVLSHNRPYKAAWEPDKIRQELQRQRGGFFDPAVVDAWLSGA